MNDHLVNKDMRALNAISSREKAAMLASVLTGAGGHEKQAAGFKAFGYLDDLLRGGASLGRAAGGAISSGVGATRRAATSDGFQSFLRGQKGFKRKPTKLPYPKTTGGFVQPPGGPATSTMLGELGTRMYKNTRNLGAQAKDFIYQPGQGAISTLLRGGAAGLGGLAAKDLATLPFGGWDNKDQFGGMRRGGLDYQRQQINPANTGLFGSAASAAYSPLKSLVSLGLGDPNANPTGIKSKYLGTSPEGIARYERRKVPVGARASRSASELQEAQTKLESLKSNLKSELQKAKDSLSSGDFPSEGGGFFSNKSVAQQRAMGEAALQARIKELESSLTDGNYRGLGGFGPSASELRKRIDEQQSYLRNLGILSPEQSKGIRQPYDRDRVARRTMLELGY